MTSTDILTRITSSIDILIRAADKYEGLFPSLLNLETHEMLTEAPPCIPGQRRGDRSHLGSNLIHDEITLLAMYGLGAALNRSDYAEAADRYLKSFATHCTDTVTGLFPWGEHAFWHLVDDGIGNSSRYHDPNSTNPAIHDQLRQAPTWLWAKLWEFNPRSVERFAEGLDWHWRDRTPDEYSRHGEIEVKQRPEDYEFCSYDFPRHGGFYIQAWAFAYVRTGREDFKRQVVRMMDHWQRNRLESGLLPYCSRVTERVTAFYRVHACAQTMGFAAGLWDSADIVEAKEPELASRMRGEAAAYAGALFSAPHDVENGVFYLAHKPGDKERDTAMPIWGSVYGVWPASSIASLCLHTFRQTQDERFLRFSEAVGSFYLKSPFPKDVAVPANDAGLALEMLADLYEITGAKAWLDGGLALAEKLMQTYMDGDLPRGAAGIDWYESQMGPSFLLYGLARIALLASDRQHCPLQAEYTTR